MKLDLQSLSAEPLVYMLMHSGAFVAVLGVVFFFIGLLFGRATWGRYKRQTRELQGEAESMKEELADLKRKLAEHSVKAAPPLGMVTEVIPMPRREVTVAPPAFTPTEINIAAKNGQTAANGNHPAKDQPQPAGEAVIKTKPPASAETSPATAEPAAHEDWSPAKAASPLATIITTTAASKRGDRSAQLLAVTLPEIPSAHPPPGQTTDIKPVFDPQLGLIYKSRPDHSDDLTALKGIAQVLEQRLHELGVYTHEQIAGWTQEQIREFSTRLAFKDRIEREQWVEQARELLASRKQPAL